jgi:adenylate cyclase class IV
MDDKLASLKEDEATISDVKDLREILSKAGFKLKKFLN